MKEKICPLLLATLPKASSKEMSYCRKDECAWWIVPPQAIKEPPGFCAILQIAEELRIK